MTTKRISTKELNEKVYKYILQSIDGEGYDVDLRTDEERIRFLFNTFFSEYGYNIDRYGMQGAFREWCMGLPSCFNIAFTNFDIIQLAKLWGSIPIDATDRECERIVENYFNFITVKTFQLFKKYKVNTDLIYY